MSEVTLSAEVRSEFGKGAARRIRRAAKVPAVLYGHGTDPVHLTLPGHATMLALKTANALLSLDIEGRRELAITKHVQRDPLKGFIEHVDLLLVRLGEKVTVDVAVVLVGEAAPATLVNLEHTSLTLEVEATHIPQRVEVSLDGLEAGAQVHAGDIALPEGAQLAGDPEMLVVGVSEAPTEADLTGEAEVEPTGVEQPVPSAPSAESV